MIGCKLLHNNIPDSINHTIKGLEEKLKIYKKECGRIQSSQNIQINYWECNLTLVTGFL